MGKLNKVKNKFKNILEFHNKYYENYKFLIKNCKNKIFIINYNDLIKPIDNIIFIYSLFSEFKIYPKRNIENILTRPSKLHGNSVRSYIEAYNKNQNIKKYFKEDEIKLIENNSKSYNIIKEYLYEPKFQIEF